MSTTTAERLHVLRQRCLDGSARQIRIDAHLSQGDIGRSVATDPSAIARWETGQRMPRGAAALKYAALLERLAKAQVS